MKTIQVRVEKNVHTILADLAKVWKCTMSQAVERLLKVEMK